jgi:hypothetical protein
MNCVLLPYHEASMQNLFIPFAVSSNISLRAHTCVLSLVHGDIKGWIGGSSSTQFQCSSSSQNGLLSFIYSLLDVSSDVPAMFVQRKTSSSSKSHGAPVVSECFSSSLTSLPGLTQTDSNRADNFSMLSSRSPLKRLACHVLSNAAMDLISFM